MMKDLQKMGGIAALYAGVAYIIGIVVGLAGVLSTLPGLSEVGLIFGLIQIIWFIWLGVFMLRKSSIISI